MSDSNAAESVVIHAPAKINLALAVGPADPQHRGYHPICSWMARVDLFDDLTLTAIDPEHFSRYAILWADDAKRKTDINWSIRSDLAVRAHHALELATKRRLSVQLKLEKRIPVGAGLGGGSSDAAAMLHGLNQLFDLRLEVDELANIGASVGSDVPFFVRAAAALVEGFGEQWTRTPPVRALNLVVVAPEFGCDTAAVYRSFDEAPPDDSIATGFEARAQRVRDLAHADDDVSLAGERLFNDLRTAAERHRPELIELTRSVRELADSPVGLTGSGSGLFVLCRDRMHAEFLARAIEEQLGQAAFALNTLPRS